MRNAMVLLRSLPCSSRFFSDIRITSFVGVVHWFGGIERGHAGSSLGLQVIRHVLLLVRKEVRIAHGHLGALMPEPVRDDKSRVSKLDEQRYMAMTQVMNAYALDPGGFRSAIHLVMEK
jgi:hypothetical protein